MVAHFEDQIHAALRTGIPAHLMNRPVFVGFSGGADSTALLLALFNRDVPVAAVHFDHGLRGDESAADALWCEAFCQSRGIPFRLEKLAVSSFVNASGGDLENTARQLRLDAWTRITQHQHAVALGHHRDDQLENLFIRLGRGSNATGLCGLRSSVRVNNVFFVRPLLSFRRTDIEAYLRESGIDSWREDASNRDESFTRNALRHRVLPMIRECFGERFERGILTSLDALEQDAEYLEHTARQYLDAPMTTSTLSRLSNALLPRVLRLLAQRETGRDGVMRRSTVERVHAELMRTSQKLRRVPLGNGLELMLDAERVRVMVSDRDGPTMTQWNWRRSPEIELSEFGGRLSAEICDAIPAAATTDQGSFVEYFAARSLPDVLRVRGWQPGDRMTPFGHSSPRKLKDLLSAAAVPVEDRPRQPVVLSDDTIVWLAGIRRAEFGRTRADEPTVCLRFVRHSAPAYEPV